MLFNRPDLNILVAQDALLSEKSIRLQAKRHSSLQSRFVYPPSRTTVGLTVTPAGYFSERFQIAAVSTAAVALRSSLGIRPVSPFLT